MLSRESSRSAWMNPSTKEETCKEKGDDAGIEAGMLVFNN